VFHAFSEKQLKQIVEIQLERLRVRLAARHIHLELTDEARASLVHSGYNANYGARPLKRGWPDGAGGCGQLRRPAVFAAGRPKQARIISVLRYPIYARGLILL